MLAAWRVSGNIIRAQAGGAAQEERGGYMSSNDRNTILYRRTAVAVIVSIAVAGILSIYYFGASTALDSGPNGAPPTSGPASRVTISLKGLSENPYVANETVSFQVKVNGELAKSDCGDVHLVVGKTKYADDNNTQVSFWNATLPCKSLTSESSRINFEHLFPAEDTDYTFTPVSSGSYMITASVSTKGDGMYVASKTFQVING